MRNVYFFLLLGVFALATAPAARCASSQDVWQLEQNTMVGKFDVYITPKAVRAIDHSHDCNYLCKAPDWKVVIYRDPEKVQMQYTLANWNWHGNKIFYNDFHPSNGAKIKWEPTKYLGLNSYRYFDSQPHLIKSRQEFGVIKIGAYKVLGYDYIMTDQMRAAPEISKFMQGLYCCSYVRDVPLANRIIIADQSWQPRFVTKKISKVHVDPAFFNAPNYKISDERSVLYGQADKAALEDFVGGLGVGSNGFGETAGKAKHN